MEPIIPLDWARMFLGEDPPLIYLEILIRTVLVWLWTMLLLRWIGGRSISQLSLVEFLLVIGLGSAVGDSLFYPDVPLLHAMLVIAVLVGLDKLVDQAIRRYQTAKTVIDGAPVAVLRDGVILWNATGARQLGASELMEMLRLKGVENLGSLRAAYLETSGQLSVFPAEPPVSGLAIVPPPELRCAMPADFNAGAGGAVLLALRPGLRKWPRRSVRQLWRCNQNAAATCPLLEGRIGLVIPRRITCGEGSVVRFIDHVPLAWGVLHLCPAGSSNVGHVALLASATDADQGQAQHGQQTCVQDGLHCGSSVPCCLACPGLRSALCRLSGFQTLEEAVQDTGDVIQKPGCHLFLLTEDLAQDGNCLGIAQSFGG